MKFLEELTDLVFLEDIPEKSDIIFIPGSGFGALARTAARLYHQGMAPLILPSGRYGKLTGRFEGSKDTPPIFPKRRYPTEWAFMKDILIQEGVSEKDILKEDLATYTYENAIYSRQVTDACGLTIKKAILCCQAYHARRCRLYYEILYPDTRFYVCPTNTLGITRENWYSSQEKIDIVLGELSRLGGQFHDIVRQYGMAEDKIL